MDDAFFKRCLLSDVISQAQRIPADWASMPLLELLRRLRLVRGLTQKDLARLSGLAPAHLSRILRGRQQMSIATLRKLLDALDCDLLLLPRPRQPVDRDDERAAAALTAALRRAAGYPEEPPGPAD